MVDAPPDKMSQHDSLPEAHTAHARARQQAGLVILGMHRSGTSCLAGMLQCAGFFAGEVVRWSAHNRRGTREDPRINDLNELILQISGGSWNTPPHQIRWTPEAATERDRLLAELRDSGAPWIFKDPRTLMVLPFWLDGGGTIGRLGIWRNPLAVAQSLATRNGMPFAQGLELWAAYNAALIIEHRRSPFPIVCFDLPREAFVAAVRSALGALGRDFISLSRLDLDRLGEFFDDTLVHQSAAFTDPVSALAGLPGVGASLVETVAREYRELCIVSGCVAPEGQPPSQGTTVSGAVLDGLIDIEKAAAAGDPDAAWEVCSAMLESFPQRVDLWLRLVDLAKASGDEARYANSITRGLAALPADPHLGLQQAKLHWKAGAHDEAVRAAERMAALAPDWIELRVQLGAWAGARKRWAEVEKWLAPVTTEGRTNRRSAVLRGVAAIHCGDVERGNRLIATALEGADRQERAAGLYKWGAALRAVGQLYEASPRLIESLALRPAAADVATTLASLQEQLGNAEAGLATARAALEAGADSPGLRLAAARIGEGLGQEPDQDIAAGLKLDPRHPGLRRLAGQRAYLQGDFSRALDHFLTAAAGRNPIAALLGAARCHAKLGNRADAFAALERVLSMDPDHVQARRLRDELARP